MKMSACLLHPFRILCILGNFIVSSLHPICILCISGCKIAFFLHPFCIHCTHSVETPCIPFLWLHQHFIHNASHAPHAFPLHLQYILNASNLGNSSATLLDNFLCKITKQSSHSIAGILLTSLSDHFPYFISLAYSKSGKHIDKYIEVKQTSHVSINNFKNDISDSDIYSKINKDIDSDPNNNYDIFHNILKSATKQHLHGP